ncbi:hypothetical protein HN937_24525 [Candidatus Poribacteria bacterium]|jgi:hypothetical protein|nr:hypothetical protein [Candidatus Poribacteria bacterium]
MLGALDTQCMASLVGQKRMPVETYRTEPPNWAGSIIGRAMRPVTDGEARIMCVATCPEPLPALSPDKAAKFGRELRAARQRGADNPWVTALRHVHEFGCYRTRRDDPDRWCDTWHNWAPRAALCAEQRIGLRQSVGQATEDCRAELCAESPTVVGRIIAPAPRWGILLGLLAAGGIAAYSHSRRS